MTTSDSNDEFAWGKAKGITTKEKKFYCSFFYENEEYHLFDNVIVYDAKEPNGHIAKIMKLWEDISSGVKMTSLRWFIRPEELPSHLHAQVLHGNSKELFLAFGKGKGVSNENKLDCIERKCKVLCTSTDARNKQPSEDDLRDADYFFKRMYNVDLKKLSNLEGIVKILGEDVLFNKTEWLSKERLRNKDAGLSALSAALNETPLIHQHTEDGQEGSDKKATVSRGNQDKTTPLKRGYRAAIPLLKKESLDLDREKGAENSVKLPISVKQEQIQTFAMEVPQDAPERTAQQPLTRLASMKKSEQNLPKANKQSLEVRTLNETSSTGRALFVDPLVQPGLLIPTRARSKQVLHQDNVLSPKMNVEENLCHGKVVLLQNVDPLFTSKDMHDLIQYAFKGCSGAEMLPQTSSLTPQAGEALLIFETEKLADSALQEIEENCLVLSGCKRPLIATKAKPPEAGKIARFPGHFPLDNFKLWKQRQEEVMKKSFEISHFSEPNTVEFEMAAEWRNLHEWLVNCWEQLCKMQREESRILLEKHKKPKLIVP